MFIVTSQILKVASPKRVFRKPVELVINNHGRTSTADKAPTRRSGELSPVVVRLSRVSWIGGRPGADPERLLVARSAQHATLMPVALVSWTKAIAEALRLGYHVGRAPRRHAKY